MTPEEIEDQIKEMFMNIPIGLLKNLDGFIIILHGSDGCAINMSKEILNVSLEEKKVIIVSLLKKLVEDPTELFNLLSYEGD